MKAKRLTSEQFEKASKGFSPSVIALNPHLAHSASAPPSRQKPETRTIQPPDGKTRKIRTSPVPKTRPEIEMAMILNRQKQEGKIESFIFEGVTLIVGDGFRSTPDFAVRLKDGRIRFVETKGAYRWRTGLQSFQAAKGAWPCFEWEMWQLVKSEWRQIA